MKSPGKPSLRRDVERLFWREIAKGVTSEEAAVAVGVSQPVGSCWFRQRGGMPLFMVCPVTGRGEPRVFRTVRYWPISGGELAVQVLVVDLVWGLVGECRVESF